MLLPVLLSAQSAPPVDLTGAWRLNTTLTDAPEQIDASVRADLGMSSNAAFADQFGGGGFGTRGGGGRRGRQAPSGPNDRGNATQSPSRGPSSEEQQTLDMTKMVRLPTGQLSIAADASMVTFTDALDAVHTFHTNGKDEKQTYDTATITSNARWEGPQLVIDFDLTKGRSMTFTYSIVPVSKQLLVRVQIARAAKEIGSFEVKHVYDRAPQGR